MRKLVQKVSQTLSNTKVSIGGCKGEVVIDGRSFQGNNISIVGDKVIIDGVEQDGSLVGNVKVEVHGDVEKIQTSSGDVECAQAGSVSTQSGDVEATIIEGSVSTMSGDVGANTINGNVSTMSGDIDRGFL